MCGGPSNARQAGATHYQVYRSIYDASQVLFLGELPGHEALREMSEVISEALGEQFYIVPEQVILHDRVWETTDWIGIG